MEAALSLIARVSFAVVDRAPMFLRMHEAARLVQGTFAVDCCVIRELVGEVLHLTACSGISQEDLPGMVSARRGLADQVLSSGKPVTVFDVPTNPATASLHSAAAGKWFQFSSYAGAPMLVQGKPLGILGIYSCAPDRRFQEKDLYHLQIIANHLAVSIQNYRLYCELKNQRDRLERQLEEHRQIEIELNCRLELAEARLRGEARPESTANS